MTYLAIIPARGGSKGIPQKNIHPLAGKPLIQYTIEAALSSACFAKVIVSTDDEAISTIALSAGAEVLKRPANIAGDSARSEDAVLDALDQLKALGQQYKHFVLLQPTSPLRTSNHIISAVSLYEESQSNALVSVCEMEHPAQKCFIENNNELHPMTHWDDLSKPRQVLAKTYRLNGAIYIRPCDNFVQNNSFFEKPISLYKMSKATSLDIDTMEDINKASFLLISTSA